MKTMLWSFDETLHIIVHSEAAPTDEEWDAYLADFPAGQKLTQYRTIVYSLGGGPNGHQRSRLVHLVRGRAPRAALLTASALMRGIGTAVSWFIRTLRVFSLEDRAAAFEYLEMSPDEMRRANATIDRFVHDLGAPNEAVTLRQ
jgi:hypothetical protein